MNGISVEIDQSDINALISTLSSVDTKGRSYFRNAINRTTTKTVRLIKDGESDYTLPKKRFSSDLKVIRATVVNLGAKITAGGRPPTLSSYRTSAPKAGGKAAVLREGGLKKLVSDIGGAAFVPTGGSAAGLLAQRPGLNGDPRSFRVLRGVAVPEIVNQVMQGKRGRAGNLEKKINEVLGDEMFDEIQRIIERSSGL